MRGEVAARAFISAWDRAGVDRRVIPCDSRAPEAGLRASVLRLALCLGVGARDVLGLRAVLRGGALDVGVRAGHVHRTLLPWASDARLLACHLHGAPGSLLAPRSLSRPLRPRDVGVRAGHVYRALLVRGLALLVWLLLL